MSLSQPDCGFAVVTSHDCLLSPWTVSGLAVARTATVAHTRFANSGAETLRNEKCPFPRFWHRARRYWASAECQRGYRFVANSNNMQEICRLAAGLGSSKATCNALDTFCCALQTVSGIDYRVDHPGKHTAADSCSRAKLSDTLARDRVHGDLDYAAVAYWKGEKYYAPSSLFARAS